MRRSTRKFKFVLCWIQAGSFPLRKVACFLFVLRSDVLFFAALSKLKFKDRYSIDTSADIHIAIHKFVYQLMDIFSDRLKLCSTTAPDCQTGQIKGRYCKHEHSFLLVSLHSSVLSVLVLYLIDKRLNRKG